MSLNSFPIETIDNIIDFLEEDIGSLHSVSLVNRTFCFLGIPHLWKNPFFIKNYLWNQYKIISIILSFLDDHTKSLLEINNQDKILLKKVHFNYPSYIRKLDFGKFFAIIDNWIAIHGIIGFKENNNEEVKDENSFKDIYFKDNRRVALFEIIYKIIVKRIVGFESILITYEKISFSNSYNPYEFFNFIFGLEDSRRCLSKLKVFRCKGCIGDKAALIDKIRGYAKDISRVTIKICFEDVNKLTSHQVFDFLSSQPKLKKARIKGFKYRQQHHQDIPITNKRLSPILESLNIQRHTITDNLFQYLSNCNQLKKLRFDRVKFVGQNKILSSIKFPNLDELLLKNYTFEHQSIDSMKSFIMNHLSNIKKIYFSKSDTLSQFLPLLSQGSSNLTFLSLCIDKSKLLLIPSILENCKNIHTLILLDIPYTFQVLDHQFIVNFLLACSKNLRILDLHFNISYSDLELLMTVCGEFLKGLKCICLEDFDKIEELIKKYLKSNNRIHYVIEKYVRNSNVVRIKWF